MPRPASIIAAIKAARPDWRPLDNDSGPESNATLPLAQPGYDRIACALWRQRDGWRIAGFRAITDYLRKVRLRRVPGWTRAEASFGLKYPPGV